MSPAPPVCLGSIVCSKREVQLPQIYNLVRCTSNVWSPANRVSPVGRPAAAGLRQADGGSLGMQKLMYCPLSPSARTDNSGVGWLFEYVGSCGWACKVVCRCQQCVAMSSGVCRSARLNPAAFRVGSSGWPMSPGLAAGGGQCLNIKWLLLVAQTLTPYTAQPYTAAKLCKSMTSSLRDRLLVPGVGENALQAGTREYDSLV